jgi:flagellum-specific peptidoglycan hydrolase FlgJ
MSFNPVNPSNLPNILPSAAGYAGGLAADAQSLSNLKFQAGKNTPESIRETAKQFESLFMRELLKSMREATMKSGMQDNPGADLGTDLLDQQYAVQMSGQRGGLSDLIAKQLMRQSGLPDTQAATGATGATGAINALGSSPTSQADLPIFTAALPPYAQNLVPNLNPTTARANPSMQPATGVVPKMPVRPSLTPLTPLNPINPSNPSNPLNPIPSAPYVVGQVYGGKPSNPPTPLPSAPAAPPAQPTGVAPKIPVLPNPADRSGNRTGFGNPANPSNTPGIRTLEYTSTLSKYKGPSQAQINFVKQHQDAASQIEKTSGIPAAFMLGQAGHETGWGKSEIKGKGGTPSYNLFGIKATSQWKGPVAEVTTTEYINGAPEKRIARFRAYGSYQEAFADYAKLIGNSPRYAQARQQTDSAYAYASGLQKAGYATDPQYALKLSNAINSTLQLRRVLT